MLRSSKVLSARRVVLCGLAVLLVSATAVMADEAISLSGENNLDAWMSAGGKAPSPGWVIEDGTIVRKDKAGYLWTRKRFGDFVLELDYKTEGNSGIFFRTDDPGNCVQTGIEVQVNTPVRKPNKHSPGALYDLLAPSKEASKAGAWNHLVITAKGPRITVELNGEQVVDANVDNWTEANKNPDGTKNKYHTALKDFSREGHVGLQDHGANVMFRNIKIKPL